MVGGTVFIVKTIVVTFTCIPEASRKASNDPRAAQNITISTASIGAPVWEWVKGGPVIDTPAWFHSIRSLTRKMAPCAFLILTLCLKIGGGDFTAPTETLKKIIEVPKPKAAYSQPH